ncbi:MAG TPA: hypothetical protein VMU50_03355, partial [Polyangia bacterium]|nr:hypothetical protein [Polyangia bacterium]
MKGALLVALAALVPAVGCGGHGGPTVNCPQDLPAACPTTPPSFASDVKPIYDSVCTSCHAPGGQMGSVPLTTYAQIFGRRTTELTQIYDCVMPPVNGPPLSDAQRTTLMTWFVCDAPNN